MQNRIIEIATDNQKLSEFRGFLRVQNNEKTTDIPFNSILALMVTAHQIVYTQNLLQRLCDEGIPLIILGKNYLPTGMLMPYIGHVKQMEIQHLQIEQKIPLFKKAWQLIIQEKIKNQSRVLDLFNKENPISQTYKYVLSGDTDNKEGFTARIYFKSLFGEDFIRNRDIDGINAFLNYGYAVLRAALARYVVAAGLNPAFGIAHRNKLNPFCLVDDLIEPFRPLVDVIVYKYLLSEESFEKLLPEHKKKFSSLLTQNFKTAEGESPLYMILQRCVWELVSIYKTKHIEFHFNPYLFESKNE